MITLETARSIRNRISARHRGVTVEFGMGGKFTHFIDAPSERNARELVDKLAANDERAHQLYRHIMGFEGVTR